MQLVKPFSVATRLMASDLSPAFSRGMGAKADGLKLVATEEDMTGIVYL